MSSRHTRISRDVGIDDNFEGRSVWRSDQHIDYSSVSTEIWQKHITEVRFDDFEKKIVIEVRYGNDKYSILLDIDQLKHRTDEYLEHQIQKVLYGLHGNTIKNEVTKALAKLVIKGDIDI